MPPPGLDLLVPNDNEDLALRHWDYQGMLPPSTSVPFEDSMRDAAPGLADDSSVSFIRAPGSRTATRSRSARWEKKELFSKTP